MTTQNRKPPTASIQVSIKRVGAERMPRISSSRDTAADDSVPTGIALGKINAPSHARGIQTVLYRKKRRQIMLCRLSNLNSDSPKPAAPSGKLHLECI